MQNRYRMTRSPLRNGLFVPATNADQPMQRLPESLLWLAGLSGFAVAVTDAAGRMVWVNDKFVHDTGWAPSELRGSTPWTSFLVPGNDATVAQRARAAVAQSLPCTGLEMFRRTPAGISPCGRLDLVPVRHEQAGLTHFVCMLSDTGVGEQAADSRGTGMGLLQDLGLIGFWQRDMLSGRGHWDTVCRRIWGVGNDEPVLTLDEAEQRLTGPDRQALQRYRAELAAGATQGDVAYTLTSPAGERQVRSLWRRSGSLVSGVLIDTTPEYTVSADRARLLQALELAALVPGRTTDPAVTKLADAIAAQQLPEIGAMKALLAQWEAEPQHADHGMPMTGMVDDATMTKLKLLRGADFDKLWLQSMIGHHQGAIEMANTEVAAGQKPVNADCSRFTPTNAVSSSHQGETYQPSATRSGTRTGCPCSDAPVISRWRRWPSPIRIPNSPPRPPRSCRPSRRTRGWARSRGRRARKICASSGRPPAAPRSRRSKMGKMARADANRYGALGTLGLPVPPSNSGAST